MSALGRILLPSWRFFDSIGPRPSLEARSGRDAASLGAFEPIELEAPRPPLRLLWNPRGNLRLAYGSLLERFSSELEDVAHDRAEGLVSFRLLRELVRAQLVRTARAEPGDVFLFRVLIAEAGAEATPSWTSSPCALE